ncbi:AGAP013230-PA-like protein [Anopheles sinensis]|uniref:AGAP013230-PA-like protein n=1 Tax=Anopheles sinensis TaxID=74873 RepID=A0A084W0C6_ANOSI|nr:AGAP013230-PA-like protein [Anopheles sinensis]
MTEELQTQQQPQPATVQPQPKQRLGPQDYRNSELVTKLMAANPPYLYSPAVGPHNFFFSEMLRSLVANKRNESLRNASEQLHHHQQHHQQQQQLQQAAQHPGQVPNHLALQAATTRRPRKRSWSQHRYYPEALKEGKESEERRPTQPEKPLELTNKLSAFSRSISSSAAASSTQKYPENDLPERFKAPSYHDRKPEESKTSLGADKASMNNANLIPEPSTASMPPSDLILPPPPPVWYPPLYPPYGIDPLHFFIDLRVSGHIYDRKKDSNSPGSEESSLSVKREHSKLIGTGADRQGSAFSVPKPRDSSTGSKPSGTGSAINLAASLEEGGGSSGEVVEASDQPSPAMGSLFLGDFADHKMDSIKNTNYVLQNLPRIYGDLNGNHKMVDRCAGDDDMNGNLSDEHEQDQDSKSVESVEDLVGDENKYKDIDLNVISDEESIAVDEN